MLKGIPRNLSPELLKVLCEMGHGDRIVIADGNFPTQSVGKNTIVIRCDGQNVPELLESFMKVIPLDMSVEKSAMLMAVSKGDNVETPIWDTYRGIITRYDERGGETIGFYERMEFYEEAKKAYAIVATSEAALYANIMLQKGVI